MAFTDMRSLEVLSDLAEPVQADYRKPQLKADSLDTLLPVTQHIDSIIKGL